MLLPWGLSFAGSGVPGQRVSVSSSVLSAVLPAHEACATKLSRWKFREKSYHDVCS